MRTHKITKQELYNNLPILTQSHQGYSKEILDKLYSMLLTYMTKHCKALFIRFDLHFPQEIMAPVDNSRLTHFCTNLKTKFKRANLDPCLFWVREQKEIGRNQHYHLILLLNGNKTQSAYRHLEVVNTTWAAAVSGGITNFCTEDKYGSPQRNGIMIKRNASGEIEGFKHCFQWGSYLAKFESKGLAPSGIREYGCSNISTHTQSGLEGLGLQLR